jgi:hypothetical protein
MYGKVGRQRGRGREVEMGLRGREGGRDIWGESSHARAKCIRMSLLLPKKLLEHDFRFFSNLAVTHIYSLMEGARAKFVLYANVGEKGRHCVNATL